MPGNEIALGFENLQVQTAAPVFSIGFDFVEPSATMPAYGGTPVDSTFEVVLYLDNTEVGRSSFNAPDDQVRFFGVWSSRAFNRVTIVDKTGNDDDEYFGQFYTGTVESDAGAGLPGGRGVRPSGACRDAGAIDAAERRCLPAEHVNGALLARHLPRVADRAARLVRRPRLVTITFAGDDQHVVTRLERFGETIARTSWWRAVVAGYCVKDGDCIGESRSSLAVRLDDTLPADVHAVDISALLRRYASAGRLGPLDSESLLLVYLPSGVSLRDAFVARYCRDGPRAFHRALRVDDQTVGYAVLPRCDGEAALTGSASHELLEMVTNPDASRPGFAFVSGTVTSGFTGAGHEPMDSCGVITRQTETVEAGLSCAGPGSIARPRWDMIPRSRGQRPPLRRAGTAAAHRAPPT